MHQHCPSLQLKSQHHFVYCPLWTTHHQHLLTHYNWNLLARHQAIFLENNWLLLQDLNGSSSSLIASSADFSEIPTFLKQFLIVTSVISFQADVNNCIAMRIDFFGRAFLMSTALMNLWMIFLRYLALGTYNALVLRRLCLWCHFER